MSARTSSDPGSVAAPHEADVRAQAAAGHQHESIAPFRELVGELQSDAASPGMTHDGHRLVAERVEEVAQEAGVGAERIVARRCSRPSVSGQIWCHDATAVSPAVTGFQVSFVAASP